MRYLFALAVSLMAIFVPDRAPCAGNYRLGLSILKPFGQASSINIKSEKKDNKSYLYIDPIPSGISVHMAQVLKNLTMSSEDRCPYVLRMIVKEVKKSGGKTATSSTESLVPIFPLSVAEIKKPKGKVLFENNEIVVIQCK